MEEFTQEIKDEVCKDINTIKRKLCKLEEEIKSIEQSHPLELSAPIMTINSIEIELRTLKNLLKVFQDENTPDVTPYSE